MLPLYVAVIVSAPAGSVPVVSTALPALSVVRVTVPSVVPPEVKVTVPVGAVPKVVFTVATMSTACPAFDGFTGDISVTVEVA